MAVRVIADTSALYPLMSLRARSLRRLLAAAADREVALVVPEIVIQELLKRFRLRYESEASKHRSAIRGLRGLGVSGLPVDEVPKLDTALVEYEAELRQRLHDAQAFVPVPADVGHYEVAERAIARRKPFSEKGAGYQDTLIWLTVLEQVKELDTQAPGAVALVSANTADFAKSDSPELHDDLRADLDALSIDPNVVRLYTSIDAFNEEVLGPEPESPPADEEALNEARVIVEDDALRGYILDDLSEGLQYWGLEEDILGVEVETRRTTVSYADEVVVNKAWTDAADSSLSIEIHVTARGEMEFELDSREARNLSTEHRGSIERWGEGVASGRLDVDLQIEAAIELTDDSLYAEIIDVQAQPVRR